MQEINLYQPVSKGVRGALSWSSTRMSLILVAVTLLGLWGFADWQVSHLRQATELVRQQKEAQAALAAAQGAQLASLSDEELEALVSRLSTSIDAKQKALAQLNGESAHKPAGFAARLRAFGERQIDGVWLDRLTLGPDAGAVSISGSTLSPDTVPRYLRSLAQDPALKGGQIDEFIIERPKKGGSAGRLTFRAGRRGMVKPESTDSTPEATADAASGDVNHSDQGTS